MNSIKTILIIEDNQETLLLYGEILRSEKFNVIETTNGGRALEVLKTSPILPDLILMDLTFPYPFMSAEDFVSSLRGNQAWRTIPILIISGQIDIEERSRALKANGLIKKPFDLDQFVGTVKGSL